MRIIWGITGAGHLLKESLEILNKITDKHTVTIILSKAAKEVIQLYGYTKTLTDITKKNKNNKIINDEDQEYSYPLSGKLTHDKYDMIIISPTTANTTAKVVNGIADTLVTNVIAQSGKGQIPTIIIPVDQKEGTLYTTLPPYLDKKICKKCDKCIAEEICPVNVIKLPSIKTSDCIGCKKCSKECPYNAIIINKKISLYIRHLDAENTKKLDNIENIITVFDPKEILNYIK